MNDAPPWQERWESPGGRAVLYLGDCRQVMPALPRPAAIVTDPPYGIDYGKLGGFSSHGWSPWRGQAGWDKERPEDAWLRALATAAETVVLWGGNYFADVLPPSMGWLIWDKGQRDFSLADCEMAWTSRQVAARVFDFPRGLANREEKHHPTQKPVALMQWCLEQIKAPRAGVVLDPYVGSGSTGVAALRYGARFVGIELDPGYFATACKRIAEASRQSDLLAPLADPEPAPKQPGLFG